VELQQAPRTLYIVEQSTVMKLQQLAHLCAVVDCGLNITQAAKQLHTSQPGLSRSIQLLEAELKIRIFVRDAKKIAGLTSVGREIYLGAKRVLSESNGLVRTATEHLTGHLGDLTIATAHTHARYSLPPVIDRFIAHFPRVRLRLRQGHPSQIIRWVSTGEADLAITATHMNHYPELALLPSHELHRVVLTKPRHPLLKCRNLTLEDIAAFPVITYDFEFSAGLQIIEAFRAKGLTPNIVLSAVDADTMKTYVHCGLGIAIVAHTAFDPKQDAGLRCVDARHLFEPMTVYVGLRRNSDLPAYILSFIEFFAPELTPDIVRRSVRAP